MQEELFKRLDTIKNNFKKEWQRYPESIKKKILIDFAINFTYNTNAIEGSTITLEETEDLIKKKISPHKPIDDVKETINHSKVFFEALQKEISLKNILEWHKNIFYETKNDIAGKIRTYPVRVNDFIAPDWQDLNRLLKDFFRWYDDNQKIHPVELAARAHYKFEKIHPFGDGNGRTGRLIIANILKKHKYPLIIIENKRRKSYYKALAKDENDFVKYFIRRYINFHKRYIKEAK